MKTQAGSRTKELKFFIGGDVHKSTTTFTVIDDQQKVVDVVQLPTRVPILRSYLEGIGGPKGLAIEEMDLAQWLYTMLKPSVDELIVCDPYRNHLLKEGAKTDVSDSLKIAQLYQGKFLKPVFHRSDKLMNLRNWIHVYDETVKSSVRIQNQYEAYVTRNAIDAKAKDFKDSWDLRLQRERVAFLDHQKKEALKEMRQVSRSIPAIALMESIPGIGLVGAFTIVATIIDPKRFRSKKVFWSYCGLVKHPRQSASKTYGYTNTRYHRGLKLVFRRAALINLHMKNPLRDYYDQLLEKGLVEHKARTALARKIAAIALSCLKHQRRFEEGAIH